jgi:hypothetical protein
MDEAGCASLPRSEYLVFSCQSIVVKSQKPLLDRICLARRPRTAKSTLIINADWNLE